MAANPELVEQTEPVRKSFLDILRKNLEIVERKAFVQRVIYIGEHGFEDADEAIDAFEISVRKVNSWPGHEERLSGLFLIYTKHFCHILEGTENGIMAHLQGILKNHEDKLGRMKLLVEYNHISSRFYQYWHFYAGKPPVLLEKIDTASDLEKAVGYVMTCIKKLYLLAEILKPEVEYGHEMVLDLPRETYQETSRSYGFSEVSRPSTAVSEASARGRASARYLPEVALIDFLLSSIYVQDLRKYCNRYGIVPDLDSYEDQVWPVPCDFIPFDVFDEPYNPAKDLPSRKQSEAGATAASID